MSRRTRPSLAVVPSRSTAPPTSDTLTFSSTAPTLSVTVIETVVLGAEETVARGFAGGGAGWAGVACSHVSNSNVTMRHGTTLTGAECCALIVARRLLDSRGGRVVA